MNTVENQTSTTKEHKQTKSKFSSNINHNEHHSTSMDWMEQQIYHSQVWIFSFAFQVVHWATGTETLFDIPELC